MTDACFNEWAALITILFFGFLLLAFFHRLGCWFFRSYIAFGVALAILVGVALWLGDPPVTPGAIVQDDPGLTWPWEKIGRVCS